jgi:hypothetical protein
VLPFSIQCRSCCNWGALFCNRDPRSIRFEVIMESPIKSTGSEPMGSTVIVSQAETILEIRLGDEGPGIEIGRILKQNGGLSRIRQALGCRYICDFKALRNTISIEDSSFFNNLIEIGSRDSRNERRGSVAPNKNIQMFPSHHSHPTRLEPASLSKTAALQPSLFHPCLHQPQNRPKQPYHIAIRPQPSSKFRSSN